MIRKWSPLSEGTERLIADVIDAGLRVHRELGPGFFAPVYRNALSLELKDRQIPFEIEKAFVVRYRETPVAIQ